MATPRQQKSLNLLLRKILCRGGLKNKSCYLATSPPYNSYFVPPSPANSPPETKKNKVVIFQKRAKKCIESIFNMDKQTIEIVQNYTYLGTSISSLGNFSLALDQLKEKALHALFNLRKHTNISKLSPSLANKIFDTMISPEVWGINTKPDFKTWESTQIEKTHLKFCKRYLEVSNKACNVACRAELGRSPLIIAINRKILNYIPYLLGKGDDSVVNS